MSKQTTESIVRTVLAGRALRFETQAAEYRAQQERFAREYGELSARTSWAEGMAQAYENAARDLRSLAP